MRYIMLIYSSETQESQMTKEEQAANFQAYYDFTNEVRAKGLFLSGEPLQPTSMATTVRLSGGKTVATDGPFAETKEQLGGFYMLECRDLDEAIEYAAKIPAAAYGSIEVRPVMELG